MMKRIIFAALLFVSVWAGATACPTGYSTTIPIVIQPQTYLSGPLSNFPMAFVGSPLFAGTGTPPGKALLSTGIDITFCDAASSGNLLAYELVANTYSTSTGAGEWWVNVPTVSNTVTETIYAFVGNASATDHSNAAGVWTAYAGVWHFGTSGTLTLTDSTGTNVATNHGATAVAGPINGGAHFVGGSSQWIDLGGQFNVTNFTLQAWLAPSANGATVAVSNATSGGTNNFTIYLNTSSSNASGGYNGGGTTFNNVDGAIGIAGVYHSIIEKHTSGSANLTLYVDGVATGSGSGTSTNPANSGVNLELGRNGASSTPLYYSGNLSEVRIASSALTADWIAADYHSEAIPSSFYQINPTPPVAFIQPVINANSSNFYSSNTCTLADGVLQSVTTGNILIACETAGSAITGNPTDTLGSSFGSPIESQSHVSGANTIRTECWIATAAGTGGDTITFSGTNSGNNNSCVEIDKNMYTATVDYHTSGQYVGTVNAFTLGAISTKSRDFFYSYIDAISSAVMQPNSPMHWLGAGSGWSIGAGYQIMGYAGSSSTAQFTFTNGSSSEAGNYIAIALQPVSLKILSTTIPTGSAHEFLLLRACGGRRRRTLYMVNHGRHTLRPFPEQQYRRDYRHTNVRGNEQRHVSDHRWNEHCNTSDQLRCQCISSNSCIR